MPSTRLLPIRASAIALAVAATLAACGDGATDTAAQNDTAPQNDPVAQNDTVPQNDTAPQNDTTAQNDTADAGGIRVVSADAAAAIQADPPDDLVILDVRTPEEFADGQLEGAVMLDFYEPDFADQLAGLDPDVPYLLYCRSGNRSGQAAALMAELGFTDVADVDGGILAWTDAGLPVVPG